MKKVKTSSKGRKCKSSTCQQILSIYNHEKYCNVHRKMGEQKSKSKGDN